jgi:hypothetical protein
MRGAIPPLTQYTFMAWCSITKSTGNFTFTFTALEISYQGLVQALNTIVVIVMSQGSIYDIRTPSEISQNVF